MWVSLFMVLLILGQRAFLPTYPCASQFDAAEEEYDYR